jgi:hypothetical protein
MSNAPSCPISRNGPAQASKTAQPSAAAIPTIPPVHDLRTVINAINEMNNIVQRITIGTPQINNIGTPPVQQESPAYARVTWREVSRTWMDQEVINPDDKEQKIKIKSLSSVTWIESHSGHQLTYEGT